MTARLAAVAALLAVPSSGSAAFLDFTQNPTTNSADFAAQIAALGGSINTDVNFNTHPLGALQPNFYLLSDGVTLTPIGDVNTVTTGAGPGQPQGGLGPFSSGEGVHPASGYLLDADKGSQLIISFATPVLGAGFFTIDHWNPVIGNIMTIEAWSGPNQTGNYLGGSFSAQYNFQTNFQYFMGLVSTDGNIGSVVLTSSGGRGDLMGIDDIWFAPAPAPSAVPEPSSALLLAIGLSSLLGVGAWRRRRPGDAVPA